MAHADKEKAIISDGLSSVGLVLSKRHRQPW